jgi:DNA-3-methyladenine glycosylase
VVTNTSGIPDAILIRALEPLEGIREMLRRTGKKKADETLTSGPGNAARAMGISTAHTGWSLQSPELFIAADNYVVNDQDIVAGPRIGVDYAGSDALLPYRFYIKGNKYVSMPNKS